MAMIGGYSVPAGRWRRGQFVPSPRRIRQMDQWIVEEISKYARVLIGYGPCKNARHDSSGIAGANAGLFASNVPVHQAVAVVR